MALGLRYPKAHEMGWIPWNTFTRNASVPHIFEDLYYLPGPTSRLYVNPSRYSEVRKVTFWVNCSQNATLTAGSDIRLRVGFSPLTNGGSDIAVAEILPGTGIESSNNGPPRPYPYGLTLASQLFDGGNTNAYVPMQRCTAVYTDRDSSFVKVEFDRFEADSVDFFNAWDAVVATSGDNDYIQINAVIERESGPWSAGERNGLIPWCVGMSVVQAPASINRTTTIINGNPGYISYGATETFWKEPRAMPFKWNAEDWDNVTSIHAWSFYDETNGVKIDQEVRVSAMRETHDGAGGSATSDPRYTETIDLPGSGSSTSLWRSEDILPSIVDGDFLGMEHRKTDSASQILPCGYFEIVQDNFNKTVCAHPSSVSSQISNSEVSGEPTHSYSKGYIDPLWYENFPEEFFTKNVIWGGFKSGGAIDSLQTYIHINAFEQDNPNTSVFNVQLDPGVTDTPAIDKSYKLRDGEIVANNPRLLLGPRTLVTYYDTTSWTAGQPGGMLIAYSLDVPNREFLDVGPLFELGAFNSEGCAATSAGLGDDPGVLVITNGSSIPKKFNPTADPTNQIEDCSLPEPFPDEVPTQEIGAPASQIKVFDYVCSPEGGLLAGSYTYRYTFRNCCTGKESDPSDEMLVDTSGASPCARVVISFAGIRIPFDPQICEICLYRSVEQSASGIVTTFALAKVGCFNVDETSQFEDTVADEALDFLNEGITFLNGPMPCVPIVVDFRNRLFGMGDIPNLTPLGQVSVEQGSDIITGSDDVEWDRCLEGKFIQIVGDCKRYEIDRVMPPEAGVSPPISRLLLIDEYEGETDSLLDYTICGRPNRLYFSEPLEPEYWPAAGFIDVEPGDGDRLMGAVSNFDRLVICKRRKTYVLTFRENPGLEVLVPARISSDIGCIGPRTFAQVASGSVWLSDRGLALYDGRTVRHIPESEMMNDLFVNPANPHYIRRDRNGRVIDAVGVFYPKREQYLLILPTIQTERGCNLMLVWDVGLKNITLLKFCQEFQSMVVGKDSDGNERVYLGDVNGFVWIFDVGDTDGVGFPNATGTVRGNVADAGVNQLGLDYLTSDLGGFIPGGDPELAGLSGVVGLSGSLGGEQMGLAGACVYTRRADAELDDPWVSRTIYAATDSTLYITPPWGPDLPAVGDDFMIGAINMTLLFKPQNYATDDLSKRDWRQVVVHNIEDFSSKLRVELLPDFQFSDPEELTIIDPVTEETGDGRIFRMDYERGRQVKPVGRYVHEFMAVRMSNFAPEEPITIINHLLMMTPRQGR